MSKSKLTLKKSTFPFFKRKALFKFVPWDIQELGTLRWVDEILSHLLNREIPNFHLSFDLLKFTFEEREKNREPGIKPW